MRRFFKLHKFPTCATSIYKQQQPNLLIQIFPWLHLNQGMTKIKNARNLKRNLHEIKWFVELKNKRRPRISLRRTRIRKNLINAAVFNRINTGVEGDGCGKGVVPYYGFL